MKNKPSDSMSVPGVFLYYNFVNDVINSDLDNSCYYFWAGRKMGKTALLSHLAEKFNAKKIFSGRNKHDVDDLLNRITDNDHYGDFKNGIIIDDLDFLTIGLLENNFNKSEKMVKLFNATTSASSKGFKIVATGRVDPGEMIQIINDHGIADDEQLNNSKIVDLWSDILSRWIKQQLSPWIPINWKDILHSNFVAEISAIQPKAINTTLDKIFKVILNLTGGHPILWGSATSQLKKISKLNNQKENIFKAENVGQEEIDKIGHFINFHVGNEISSVIQMMLQEIPKNYIPKLIQFLSYKNDQRDQSEITPDARDLLAKSGFIFFDYSQNRYQIPGKILEDEIKRFCDKHSLNTPQCSLKFDSVNPNSNGHLIIAIAGEEITIALKGSSWRIIKYLYEAKGKILSNENLKEISGLKTDTAVRSALTRLEKKIRESGHIDLIENIRGEGYKFKLPIKA
jgi:hypothetical protein